MAQSIFVPAIVFTFVVLAFSLLVLATRAWLVPSGDVSLTINRNRKLRVRAGQKLLWTLAEQGILLPAACGGRGSCGQCRVQVISGGGSALQNEATHISRRDIAHGMRLACMVAVSQDLEIGVASELLETKRWLTTVRSSRNVAPFLRELVLELPAGQQLAFEAGDYIVLEAPPHAVNFRDIDVAAEFRSDWERFGLLDLSSHCEATQSRAYSLVNAPQESDRAVLLVRLAPPPPSAPPGTPPGKVSTYIYSLKPGDRVAIAGPFGDFNVTESRREMVLIAGGAGVAPMRSIVRDQLLRGTGRRIRFWFGARDVRDLCYREEFDELAAQHENFEWHGVLSDPAPDSRWSGPTGFVHAVVYEEFLRHHPRPEDLEYYLCGPPLMSTAVLDMLDDLGIEREQIFFDDFGA